MPRTGEVFVGGRQVIVLQAAGRTGPGCPYEIDPSAVAVGARASSSTVEIFGDRTCTYSRYQPIMDATWARWETPDVPGVGRAELYIIVEENRSPARRSLTATIGTAIFTLVQDGTNDIVCTYALSPPGARVPVWGGSASIELNTQPGCAWSIEETALVEDWVSFLDLPRGVGSARIHFTAGPNPTGRSRGGDLLMYGRSGGVVLRYSLLQDAF